jgi:hypothetical protein
MTTFEIIQSLLSTIPEDSRNISYTGFALLITASIASSVACSYLYLLFYDRNSTGSKVYRAFPLMGPAITCIFLTVQFSLPLSLGLLGALSIVRFRTPIKEPEEIGFILLLIALSLSIATFNLSFTIILFILAFLILFILQFIKGFESSNNRTSLLHVETAHGDKSGIEVAHDITETLKARKVVNKPVSINLNEGRVYITFRIRVDKLAVSDLFKELQDKYPAVSFSFHEA